MLRNAQRTHDIDLEEIFHVFKPDFLQGSDESNPCIIHQSIKHLHFACDEVEGRSDLLLIPNVDLDGGTTNPAKEFSIFLVTDAGKDLHVLLVQEQCRGESNS